MKAILILAAAAGLTGCYGPTYGYAPETTNAVAAGLPATRIAIPQEAPQGSVEVASYGITRLDGNVPALHVRMIVANDGDDTPWHLDTREQKIEIAGEGQSRALFVNTNVRTLPNVEIGRHDRRTLDLFFPLPATVTDAAHVPQFELLWQVDTATRTVASRSEFERYDEDVAYNNYYYGGAVWAPYWWYDPFYSSFAFYHRPFVYGHVGRVGVGRFAGHFRAGGGHVARGGGHHR